MNSVEEKEEALRILGVDPGTYHSGYAILELTGNKTQHLIHGSINADKKLSIENRIKYMADDLEKLIIEYQPNVAAIEQPFLGFNTKSLIKLSLVQGAFIYVLKSHNVSIKEISPKSVKLNVTGNGAATKEQVRLLTIASLGINSDEGLDATDALAVALSVTQHCSTRQL